MEAKVQVTLNSDQIHKLEEASRKAFEMTVEAVLSDIKASATVPHEHGTLEDSGFTDIDVESLMGKVIFDTPYARRLYWNPEYNFRTDKNANASGMWMAPYVDGAKQNFITDTFMRLFKEQSGGLIR